MHGTTSTTFRFSWFQCSDEIICSKKFSKFKIGIFLSSVSSFEARPGWARIFSCYNHIPEISSLSEFSDTKNLMKTILTFFHISLYRLIFCVSLLLNRRRSRQSWNWFFSHWTDMRHIVLWWITLYTSNCIISASFFTPHMFILACENFLRLYKEWIPKKYLSLFPK